MAKADIEHMIEWKKRRGAFGLTFTQSVELERLAKVWRSKADEVPEFADFIPMRIVTIVEVFVREVIRELVDHSSVYLERAEGLAAKNAKFDFALLSGLSGRQLSVGDLIAHTVSLSEPTRIVSYLKALVSDFPEKLQNSHPRWTEEQSDWPLPPIIEDFSRMMARLSRLFAVRHIVTHELPQEPSFDAAEINGFLEAADEFIAATNWVLVETLHGHVPRTQATMNAQAADEMAELQDEMDKSLVILRERGGVADELLDASQAAWEVYADKEANFRASLVEGGSMYPMIWRNARTDEIRRRLETLRWWVDREEYDL